MGPPGTLGKQVSAGLSFRARLGAEMIFLGDFGLMRDVVDQGSEGNDGTPGSAGQTVSVYVVSLFRVE